MIVYSCPCRANSVSKKKGQGLQLHQQIALSLVLAILLSGTALAHAKITSTIPADGDFVPSPRSLVLNFDNEVELTGAELHTVAGVSAEGRTIEGEVVELGFDTAGPARSFLIEVAEPLPPGEYYLVWRCVADDSHFSTGEFFFTVVSD